MSDATSLGREALVSGRGEGRTIHVLGADLTIKISSRDTNGAFTVFEGHTEPLEGPPLHRHPGQDEWWYIVEGEYRFEVDGREIHASAGATVFAPRGSRHTFQNVGNERGWTITTAVPGGLDLFFEELKKAAPRGAAPELDKTLPVFEKHGLELLGAPLRARTTAAASAAD
jgi:mannose-6-phosphate isomerase-like protein (cupin superfamily)